MECRKLGEGEGLAIAGLLRGNRKSREPFLDSRWMGSSVSSQMDTETRVLVQSEPSNRGKGALHQSHAIGRVLEESNELPY